MECTNIIMLQISKSNINQLVQWPMKYSMSISSSDEVEDRQMFLLEDVIAVINRTVLEANLTLPSKRLWDVTLLAYGCPKHRVTDAIKLSKILL